jgi:hypothetical protein
MRYAAKRPFEGRDGNPILQAAIHFASPEREAASRWMPLRSGGWESAHSEALTGEICWWCLITRVSSAQTFDII